MRRRLILILLLLVVLPLGLLAWFGLRLAASEQTMLEHQLRLLGEGQLRTVDAQLQGVFDELGAELQELAGQLPRDAQGLRRLPFQHPLVRQVFVMGPRGERLHPPPRGPLSLDETHFLARTEAMWRDQVLLHQQPPSDAPAPRSGSRLGREEPLPSGWLVWHAGDETSHIFWQRRANGSVVGFELHPARVLAELIAALPDTPAGAEGHMQRRLLDGGGRLAYAWGGFRAEESSPALAVLPLSHPLSSWRLEFRSDGVVGAQASRTFTLLVAGLVAALALAAMAVYLYREHTRELRLAAQRVSFVNQVSHELKTPLTNIRLYAELLEQEVEEEPRAHRYLEVIHAECQRLSRLINNVLSFARAEKGRLGLNPRPVNPDECIGGVLAAFRPALEARQVTIRYQAGAPDRLVLDPDALEQILTNLLSNVEKYAAEGGCLELVSDYRDGRLRVTVTDAGPGIPAAERTRIFEPFYRVGGGLTEGVSGTGIGLSIARELARRHGGDLVLLPSARGASFQLTLSAAGEKS